MELFLSVIFFNLSTGAFVYVLFDHFERQRLWRSGGFARSQKIPSPTLNMLGLVIEKFSSTLGQVCLKGEEQKINRLIVAGGLEDVLSSNLFFSIRVGMLILGGVLSPIIFTSNRCVSAMVGAVAGCLYTMIWLKSRVKLRKEKIELALPGALDWLVLSVEAGLDFAQALSRIAKKLKAGPLKDEFLKLDSSLRMGITRKEALTALSDRAGVPSITTFASLLIQADLLGASIGPVLRSSSQKLRGERLARAEKKGVAAAQKALLPLALFIMPTTFIVIFGPLIVRLFNGGFSQMFQVQ